MRTREISFIFVLSMAMVACYVANLITLGWLNTLGLHPRSFMGLLGIFTSPFLHASFFHLLGNLLTFVPLAVMTALSGKRNFIYASLIIVILGGAMTWLMGRDANHIGASGLVFGLWAFVVSYAYQRRDFKSICMAILVLVLFTGLPMGLIPRPGVSFEGHLFGLIAGIIAAKIIMKMKPGN
jgi:membrane associated rhomboid family serine protease